VTVDLPIPDAALQHRAVQRGWITEHDVATLARPVVVAYLRQMCPGDYMTRRDIMVLADELENQQ